MPSWTIAAIGACLSLSMKAVVYARITCFYQMALFARPASNPPTFYNVAYVDSMCGMAAIAWNVWISAQLRFVTYAKVILLVIVLAESVWIQWVQMSVAIAGLISLSIIHAIVVGIWHWSLIAKDALTFTFFPTNAFPASRPIIKKIAPIAHPKIIYLMSTITYVLAAPIQRFHLNACYV